MVNYSLRKLEKEDIREFEFIVNLHEILPAAWIDNYTVDYKELKNNINRLIKQHDNPEIFCSVAENKKEIIGFVWAEINENNKEILDIISLWTDKKYRGQGIATKLKIEMENWAKKKNIKKIITTVSGSNDKMISLNKELGYEINYYTMVKKI